MRIISCFIPDKTTRKNIRNYYNIIDNGKNNKFIVLDDAENVINTNSHKNLQIIFNGDNNVVTIHSSTIFRIPISLTLESQNNIYFGKRCGLTIDITSPLKNVDFHIGNNVYSNGTSFQLHDESGLKVHIGDNTMFSFDTIIRPSDGHTIYEKDSRKILNYPKAICIGKHCWIGMRAMILKGANIPSDSIIAAGAIVTENSSQKDTGGIFAGIPAKLIKENVNWDAKNTDFFDTNIENLNIGTNK